MKLILTPSLSTIILLYFRQASNIHQQCLDKMPSIHSTPMWKVMKNVAWIVTNGLRVSSYVARGFISQLYIINNYMPMYT